MGQNFIIYFIFITLIQFSFLDYVSGDNIRSYGNVTYQKLSLKSGRQKRALSDSMPITLNIKIRDHSGMEIDLIWFKTDQYLANEHLVVTVPVAEYIANNNVLKDLGEYVMYHDIKKCSAVVYFAKSNTISGVIGTDYHIRDLPYNFDENGNYLSGIVGEPYILKHEYSSSHIHPSSVFPPPSDWFAWDDFLRPPNSELPSNSDINHHAQSSKSNNELPDVESVSVNTHSYASCSKWKHGVKRPAENDPYETNKRQHTAESSQYLQPDRIKNKRYYSETLVFITEDLVDIFKNKFGDNYIESIIIFNLIYFNVVDMMFKNLQTNFGLVMHINIAEIFIEDPVYRFNFVTNDGIEFTQTISKIRQYLHMNEDILRPDSFDHAFVWTSKQLWDSGIQVNALTKYGADIYEAIKNDEFYTAVPISIVKFRSSNLNYINAVHEIAKIFNIKIDPKEKGVSDIGQCYGIMQREGSKCMNCLKWSDQSKKQFKNYIKTNRNRCFFLNEPWSLRPTGPLVSLSARIQCQCYGYDSHYKNINKPLSILPKFRCDAPLLCKKDSGVHSSYISTIRPLDGTPCGHQRVCWMKKCLPISN